MLNLEKIVTYYPLVQRVFKGDILREYLQYKILEIIFDSKFAFKISFSGGCALRIAHGNNRFSREINFDSFNLSRGELEELIIVVQKRLELEGCSVEIKEIFTGAYNFYIKVPKMFYEDSSLATTEEKILINLGIEPQEFSCPPHRIIVNRFDIFSRINVVPIDILLAHKIYTIFNCHAGIRGRDFYDAIFLFGKTQPNLQYLKFKFKTDDTNYIKDEFLSKCTRFNFASLAKDVSPFLINGGDSRKILFFYDYIKSINFEEKSTKEISRREVAAN